MFINVLYQMGSLKGFTMTITTWKKVLNNIFKICKVESKSILTQLLKEISEMFTWNAMFNQHLIT